LKRVVLIDVENSLCTLFKTLTAHWCQSNPKMSAYGADDLASLPELDENILLHELKVRFQQNIIYVSTHKLLDVV